MSGELIETRLRVATWNLWWRFGPWEERLPLIVEELARIDADVICLQEVWSTDGTSSARHVADALGHHAVEASRLELEPGVGFGNAVVSRWPITGSEWRPLSAGSGPDEHRLVLRADVDGPRGALQVFSTHLNWRMDHSAIRQVQVRELAQLVADSRPREYPPIVCGDFNAEPHSAEMGQLTGLQALAVDDVLLIDGWRVAHSTDPGFSWDGRNPFVAAQLEWDRRIDYVLVGWPKAGGAGNVVHAELFGTEPTGGIWPSDHFGVLAELRY